MALKMPSTYDHITLKKIYTYSSTRTKCKEQEGLFQTIFKDVVIIAKSCDFAKTI